MNNGKEINAKVRLTQMESGQRLKRRLMVRPLSSFHARLNIYSGYLAMLLKQEVNNRKSVPFFGGRG